VLLDQLLARVGRVRVDAERGDPERAADGPPVDPGDADPVQLVDVDDASDETYAKTGARGELNCRAGSSTGPSISRARSAS
jgi:hypothetical protein